MQFKVHNKGRGGVGRRRVFSECPNLHSKIDTVQERLPVSTLLGSSGARSRNPPPPEGQRLTCNYKSFSLVTLGGYKL